MAYYHVLPPPAGTLGYKPRQKTALEQVFTPEFGKGASRGVSSSIYRKAAEREGLVPKYEIDAEGNVKTTYARPKEEKGRKPSDIKSKLQLFLTGYGEPADYGFSTKEDMDLAREKFAKEVKADKYLRKYFGVPEEKEKKKRTYREGLQDVLAKRMTQEKLIDEFPDKAEEIPKDLAPHYPVKKAPGFTKGTGTPFSKIKSFRSPRQAEIPKGSVTATVIGNITNESKLNSFVKKVSTSAGQKAAAAAGIDWKAILEYFGRTVELK